MVDDVAANTNLVAAYLEGLDCEVHQLSSGAEALAALQGGRPDLVLLDVQMPCMDGFEVCRRIKSAQATRLVPVVMITALNALEDRVRALEAGADDFLAKPVARVELIARVTSLLRLTALYESLEDSEEVISALARAVEAKDAYTETHTTRVASSARRLGQAAGLVEGDLDQLYRGGVLHDIGKIGCRIRSCSSRAGWITGRWRSCAAIRASGRRSCARCARRLRSWRSSAITTSESTARAIRTGWPAAISRCRRGSYRSATRTTP